jgi:hypothetical protein
MDKSNFATKFDIVYNSIKQKLIRFGVNDYIYESLIDIITDIWTEDILNGGYDCLYQHLRYSSCPAIQEWTLIELLDQFVDETSDYWSDEYLISEDTQCRAHRRLHEVIDQTFTPIELTTLAVKLHQIGIAV